MGFSLRSLKGTEAIVIGLLLIAALSSRALKGGKGSGGAPRAPSSSSLVWSEDTMRLFASEMGRVPIDAQMVLLAIACASNFQPDEYLGNNVGLLLVRRDDLAALGYPGVPKFEEIDAAHQIPWIARVIAYRVASSGSSAPTSVGDLAVLLAQPTNPTIADALRNEAERRARVMATSPLYVEHQSLLQRVNQ
jgi:hypothetical protein